MALFKILKGNKGNLPQTKTEGWMYVTQDTGDIYVDTSSSERKQLNADLANRLRQEGSNNLLKIGEITKPVYFENGVPVECGTILAVDINGNAASATKATQDASGNNIGTTYATKGELTTGLDSKLSIGANAASATKATQDGSGNVITSTYATQNNLNSHAENKNNPHSVSLSQLGVNATAAELNIMDGVTATTAEINKLKGLAATAIELNVLDGITATTAELNVLDGVTATTAEINKLDGLTTTTTELNYVDGVTSNIQTQLNGKLSTTGKAASAATADSATNATNASQLYINGDTTSKLYVLGATGTGNQSVYRESSVYISGDVIYGAAWNDYAEYRETKEAIEPGRVVCETGKGDMVLSSKRMQPGANIVSDTFGFAIGQTEICGTPIAVSGRALVYTYEDKNEFAAGDPVCAGPNGTVSKMSRVEVQEYPDRMIGTVSEIPEYEYWGQGNVEVNGRIWVKVL